MSQPAADFRANYPPVTAELAAIDVDVTGSLPSVAGTYLRNGPNRRRAQGNGGFWADGQGMVHAVQIEDGRARYSNRWVRTPTMDEPVSREWRDSEPASAGLRVLGPDIALALGDGSRPWRLDPVTLETDGVDETSDAAVGRMLPHVELVDGTAVTISSIWLDPAVSFLERDAAGRWTVTGRYRVERRPVLHDLRVVADRVVVVDHPWLRTPSGPHWDPTAGAAIALAPRTDGGPAAMAATITPTFVSHLATAWQQGAVVHIVGCRRRVPGINSGEHNPFETSAGSLRRWSIDTTTGAASEVDIDDAPCDFPALLPDGRRVVVTRPLGDNFTVASAISVVDLDTGVRDDHWFGPGRVGGEFVALGVVNGRSLVAGLVFDIARQASELVVLDVDDLDAGAVATVRLPTRVPYGLHGAWLAA
jgi:carotenoid cleavage dioxygenase-like enzyme